ncbi:hypothetical protein R1Y80_19120 [Streptomyces sp. JL1001]|uniref:Uncharacterized protein n=1 Tax=Streptomyces sp. JL1001 TaxID=3078227 RepID=A0AAU8KGW7_9ACTN|nr:hypothetical protein [Streptomyces sp. CB02613]
MTEPQQSGRRAASPWRRRGWRRRLALLVYSSIVFGLCTVFWHVVLERSWEDSFTAALIVVVTTITANWISALIQRRTGPTDG